MKKLVIIGSAVLVVFIGLLFTIPVLPAFFKKNYTIYVFKRDGKNEYSFYNSPDPVCLPKDGYTFSYSFQSDYPYADCGTPK